MYSPTESGGGRRQHSSTRWARLKTAGRVVLALAAGAGFGALAWEPASHAKSNAENDRAAVELQREFNAGQDAHRPHLDALAERHAPVGDALSSDQRRDNSRWVARAPGDGATDGYLLRITRADQKEVDAVSTTSDVHSRAPPRD